MSKPIDQELDIFAEIRDRLYYDSEAGLLIWKVKPCKGRHAGEVAGSTNKEGYVRVDFLRKSYMAHRLIWAHVHGEWPGGQMDHIDGDRSSNRISNLRVVSNSGNQKNKSLGRLNKSGCLGVRWCKRRGAWISRITSCLVEYKLKGGSLLDAAASRKSAEMRLGFSKNHGRPRNDQYIKR